MEATTMKVLCWIGFHKWSMQLYAERRAAYNQCQRCGLKGEEFPVPKSFNEIFQDAMDAGTKEGL